jgi:hypothetical protein
LPATYDKKTNLPLCRFSGLEARALNRQLAMKKDGHAINAPVFDEPSQSMTASV